MQQPKTSFLHFSEKTFVFSKLKHLFYISVRKYTFKKFPAYALTHKGLNKAPCVYSEEMCTSQ